SSFHAPSSTLLSTLSLHDALPICFHHESINGKKNTAMDPPYSEHSHSGGRLRPDSYGSGRECRPVCFPASRCPVRFVDVERALDQKMVETEQIPSAGREKKLSLKSDSDPR